MATARVMARRTSRPGTLIAARRLADDPRAAFRAVSGLVLALFITTVAVVGITTQECQGLHAVGQRRGSEGADGPAGRPSSPFRVPKASPGPAAPAAPLAARLRAIPRMRGWSWSARTRD